MNCLPIVLQIIVYSGVKRDRENFYCFLRQISFQRGCTGETAKRERETKSMGRSCPHFEENM